MNSSRFSPTRVNNCDWSFWSFSFLFRSGEIDTLNCCFDLAWDVTTETWFKLSSSVGIQELQMEEAGDDKFYDLMGRELPEAPIGQIYIQNRKRYFRFE